MIRQRKAFEKMQEKEKNSKKDDMGSLELAIARNRENHEKNFNGFLEALEKKYSKGSPKTGAKKASRSSTRNK